MRRLDKFKVFLKFLEKSQQIHKENAKLLITVRSFSKFLLSNKKLWGNIFDLSFSG